MGLADEIASLRTDRRSEIERAIAQLSGNDLKDFVTALNNVGVPASAISRALAKRKITLDPRRISEYRNNGGRIRYGLDGKRVSE